MNPKIKNGLGFIANSISESYSQIFFSNNKWLALLMILASFIDPFTGLSGLLCVVVCIGAALWLGLNPYFIRNGTYSFNALLVGLALGYYFQFNAAFFFVLILASLITLFITLWLASALNVHKMPFLSLPFIISLWIVMLASHNLGALKLSERSIYFYNEIWRVGGSAFVSFYEKTQAITFPHLIYIYIKSLGALIFQYNVVAGLLLLIGLILYSRIAFTLSVIGFAAGYSFCYFLNGNLSELDYSYIGFNYILSAIAIGGFFVIPSKRSYLLAALSAPVLGLLISGLGSLVAFFHLPVYSLPFSIVVLLILFTLQNRYFFKGLEFVQYQSFSPEKNIYGYLNRIERFKNDTLFHIHLPFYGEWTISQGHDGKVTHKDDWRFAWDFVVADKNGKTFRQSGNDVTDYYCYGLPVLAPSSGLVIALIDGIEDNKIGEVNVEQNWGNTIVIKHTDYLFTKISHIKNGSFKVKKGDYVTKGDILALCGNSGRSPEPHLHFQIQSTHEITASTIKYPLSFYVSRADKKFAFHAFDYPAEGDVIFRPVTTPLIQQAFHFTPGSIMEFEMTRKNKKTKVTWEIMVDSMNHTYIYCRDTGSVAYFTNNGTLHYFTSFSGDRNSLLYYFYLGSQKILLSYLQGIEVKDILPVEGFYSGIMKTIQDFVIPFWSFLNTSFTTVFSEIDDEHHPGRIVISSSAKAFVGKRLKRNVDFNIVLAENKIKNFVITDNDECITAERIK